MINITGVYTFSFVQSARQDANSTLDRDSQTLAMPMPTLPAERVHVTSDQKFWSRRTPGYTAAILYSFRRRRYAQEIAIYAKEQKRKHIS